MAENIFRRRLARSNKCNSRCSFTSEPDGAEVYVDDSFVGKTPIVLNIKLGHHYARMFAKDYKNWSKISRWSLVQN